MGSSLLDEARQHANGAYAMGDAIIARLATIEDNTRRREVHRNYRYVKNAGTVGAAATDATVTNYASTAADWIIERISCTGGPNGLLAIYLDEQQPQNLVAFQPQAAINAWAESNGIYVPSGRPLIAHFYNQPNNQQVSVNYRVTEIELEDTNG